MKIRKAWLVFWVLGISSTAQAAVPVGFLRAMEHSVRGAELLTQIRAYAGESLDLVEIAQVLERSEFAPLKAGLLGRASRYFLEYNPEALAEVAARGRQMETFYATLQGRAWDAVIRQLDSRFLEAGIYHFVEFVPRRGAPDFVGLRMLTGPLAN